MAARAPILRVAGHAGSSESSEETGTEDDGPQRPATVFLGLIAGGAAVIAACVLFSVASDADGERMATAGRTRGSYVAADSEEEPADDVYRREPWAEFTASSDSSCGGHIRALQFSPHAECYSRRFDPAGICPGAVQDKVEHVLTSKRQIDFASIIYSHGKVDTPARGWAKVYASCPLAGPPSGDDAMLLYNTDLWFKNGSAAMGCLGADRSHGYEAEGVALDETRRPYIVQLFQHRFTSLRVIVVAAHFPHRREYAQNMWKLRRTVENLVTSSGVTNVILISDTNQARGAASSGQILHDIGAPFTGDVKSTWLFPSCCFPHFSIVGYDRIIANFGMSMEEYYPFTKADVARWGQRNMHLPVLGSLQVSGELEGPCPALGKL